MTQIRRLEQTWTELGRDDPLWAVVSHDDKRGGRWVVDDFMRTGEIQVTRLHDLLVHQAGAPDRFAHVLDFGCGVGRLSAAWGRRAARVTGVDISVPMIERGRVLLGSASNVDLRVNKCEDLSQFEDGRYDLVFSFLCLQHVPWNLAAGYLREFARICAEGKWVAFQIATRRLKRGWAARLRRWIVDTLPFGLDRKYRSWRHGTAVAFDVYVVPAETVERAVADAGLDLIHREPSNATGDDIEGFFYIFHKPVRESP